MREYRPHGAYVLVGQCHRGDIRMPALEQIGQPSLSIVDLVLCRQDGRARPMDQQRAQVRIAAFTHPEQRWLAAAGALARNQAQLGRDLPAVVKAARIRDRCDQCARRQWADARDLLELTAELAAAVPGDDLPLELLHLPIQLLEMISQALDQVAKRHG